MPDINANALIFTAADYKILFTFGNGASYPIVTSLGVDTSAEREQEFIHAIGTQKPIGNKMNAAKYSGSVELQAGEAVAMYAAAGIVEGTQIENAKLSIVSFNGVFARVYTGITVTSEGWSAKAKDKDSKISLKWTAFDLLNA